MSNTRVHANFDQRQIDLVRNGLPVSPATATDKYFTRSLQILQTEKINPWIVMQVFVRRTPQGKEVGTVSGIHHVLAVLSNYTKFFENGGRVWAVPDGEPYGSCDTMLVIEGWAQDFIELETIYLGVLSGEITRWNLGPLVYDPADVTNRFKALQGIMRGSIDSERMMIYFGARHNPFWIDSVLTAAAYKGGATHAATDGGAYTAGQLSVGTTPHVTENIFAYYHGEDRAVVEATLAFDRVIDRRVARVTLSDYRNKEVTDTIACAKALAEAGSKLAAGRIDTNGAILAEGAASSQADAMTKPWYTPGMYLPRDSEPKAKFWYGNGVTVTAAIAMNHGLREAGFGDTGVLLTSGFSDSNKLLTFTEAEYLIGQKLFSGIGVGEVTPGFFATADVVAVGYNPEELRIIHKAGRPPKPNRLLMPAMGEIPNGLDPYRFLKQ